MFLKITVTAQLHLILFCCGPGYRAHIHIANSGLEGAKSRGHCATALAILLHLCPASFLPSKQRIALI